jgi:hypothetical protein
MSNINILKRSKTIKKLPNFYLNHPSFETVKQLYLNNVIKSIASVEKTLNSIKVKKNGELYKTAVKKVQVINDKLEKLEELRPIESFFNQINKSLKNKSLILTPIQQKVFKNKVLQDKYVVEMKLKDSSSKFSTMNNKYIDGIIKIMTDGFLEGDVVTTYSDGAYTFDYTTIDKFIFKNVNEDNVKFIDNKSGSFFNYLNNTKLDLTRYQIIRKEDDGVEVNKEQCLIHCFKLLGLDEASINAVILSVCSDAKSNIGYIPKSALNKICGIIKKQIVIHSYENKTTKTQKQTYGKEYSDIYDIAVYKSHYFVQEETIYNKYFIDNYEKLIGLDNCFNIVRMSKGKYYEYKEKRCNTLYLVNKLFEQGYFIKDTSIINSLVGSKVIDSIPLDNIEQEQKLYECKEKDDEERDIFYADLESDVISGSEHQVLMIGVVKGSSSDEPKTFILDDRGPDVLVKSFLSYVKNNCKFSTVPIIYFHNLKYDYMGLIKKYLIIKEECTKNNQVYSVKGFFYKFQFELRDTYKLINIKLEKFPSTFGLSINKKEAIAYKYYTKDNIQLNIHNVKKYIDSFDQEKDKELFKKILQDNKKLFEFKEAEKTKKYDLDYGVDVNYGDSDNDTFNATKYYEYYLKYDCLVLKQGIEKFVKIVEEITGRNEKSPLFLHSYLTISSLTNSYMGLNGAFDDVYTVRANLREYISGAIYGGRVNVCNEYKKLVINEVINDYDAVSLYPSAIRRMCLEIGIPKGVAKKIINFNINDDYFIARFKITAINKKQQNPFIAVKSKEGINYINELFNNEPIILTIDKITLEDYINFHHIEFEFIDGVYWNEGFNKTMGDLIFELFTGRIEYKQLMKKLKDTSDEYSKCNILQEIIKLMMNSSYGKTILKKSNTKTSFIYNTAQGKEENGQIKSYVCNNFNTIKEFVKINKSQTQVLQNAIDDSYNLAHVGVLILSYSKRIMNEVMGLASDNKIDIYYQDTDSMHLKNVDIVRLESLFFNKYNRQIRGENLSQFHSDFKLQGAKKEVVSVKSIFLGKKSYVDVLQSENDKGEIITGYHLRMKGISESALQYASETKFKGDYFKLYESLSNGNEQKFILNPYKHSVSFEYVKGGIRSRGYQEFERVVKF